MSTFADLGIPFPLFEAPTREASDYAGLAICRLCRRGGRHCFDLGIGDDLILPCPACGLEAGLDPDERGDVACRGCGSTVPFPDALHLKHRLLACYDGLRAGKVAMTKDTEFGMVSWERAIEGVTLGHPGLRADQFEIVATGPRGGSPGARVPVEHMWELLRTPGYISWQGENWLFCCRRPMTYLGGWGHVSESLGTADRDAFFRGLFDPGDDAVSWGPDGFSGESACLYIYRCRTCGRHRAHYDFD